MLRNIYKNTNLAELFQTAFSVIMKGSNEIDEKFGTTYSLLTFVILTLRGGGNFSPLSVFL